MAAADYLDDDEFDDYNPHPYAGGYDISAAYGSPLPPSPATCYPVSSRAAVPAPTAPQPRSPLPKPPSPRPQPPASPAPAPLPRTPPAQPRPSSPPAPVAEPYYWPKPYDYGDAPIYRPVYATPEVFRRWPYLPGPPCRSACGRDYWRQCMRGLDYLFGHADGYGERRIGEDCLGVPVYANRKGGVEDAVVVEVAPPVTGTVEWHDAGEDQYYQSNGLSWSGNAEQETHTYAQPTHHTSYDRSCEPSYGVWDQNRSYEPSYGVSDENQPYEPAYGVSHETQTYEPTYGVSDETSWLPNQSYQEGHREEQSQYQEFLSYNEENKISSQPIFSYNQHFSEQPLHFHVEPPETVSSHKLECYENFSTYSGQNNVDNLESSGQSYEIQQPYMHMPYDQLEPYRPSWSLNPGYYQACPEAMTMTPEYDNHTLASGDCWDMSSLFMSPFYPQETQVYQQSHGDENV